MTVYLYTRCWNDAHMLPFFFKRFAEKGGAWMHDYDVEWNAVSAPASAST